MKIGGQTRIYAVLGHPVGHTLSPTMHNAAFGVLGMDAVYAAFDVHPDRVASALKGMADMGFAGVNVTVPLKEVAFACISDLDESARRLRAVNTIEFLPDGLRGHNTDGKGFLDAVRESFGVSVAGLSMFVLGCGGAGRAVAITCAAEGAKRLTLVDVDSDRARRLAEEVRVLGPAEAVEPRPDRWLKAAHASDLIVQATPVGMKPGDASPVGTDVFRSGQLAFDLVYMHPETAFMRAARTAGAKAANGLGMLLHQGAESFAIWTGRPAPVEIMRIALEREVYGAL